MRPAHAPRGTLPSGKAQEASRGFQLSRTMWLLLFAFVGLQAMHLLRSYLPTRYMELQLGGVRQVALNGAGQVLPEDASEEATASLLPEEEVQGDPIPSTASSSPPSTPPSIPYLVIYRVIGNDMPPLQAVGQLRKNTEYALEHEPNLVGVEKRWVLNRIANATEKALILRMLQSHGVADHQILNIAFNATQLAEQRRQQASKGGVNITVNDFSMINTDKSDVEAFGRGMRDYIALNQGRNAAIADGIKTGARWIACFDGNQFVPSYGWSRILKVAKASDATFNTRYIAVPMIRMMEEQQPSWLGKSASLAAMVEKSAGRMEEEQLIFRNDAQERFNENMAYSLAPKQELLARVCDFKSRVCACHAKDWWWRYKGPKKMKERMHRCGVSIRLWNYPEGEATTIKKDDGIKRRDLRLEAAKRFVTYVNKLLDEEDERQRSPGVL